MGAQNMVLELTRDHDGLRIAMRTFAQAMHRADAADMSEIARRRIAFSQLFRDHMAREDSFVQQLRRLPPSARAADIVNEHGAAIRALFLRYSDHIKYWSPAQISADWPGYRAAVLALQASLHERMIWEERNLHPLTA